MKVIEDIVSLVQEPGWRLQHNLIGKLYLQESTISTPFTIKNSFLLFQFIFKIDYMVLVVYALFCMFATKYICFELCFTLLLHILIGTFYTLCGSLSFCHQPEKCRQCNHWPAMVKLKDNVNVPAWWHRLVMFLVVIMLRAVLALNTMYSRIAWVGDIGFRV